MSAPTISIIIPVYNGESVIGRSIRSVLEQRYHNFELIVIDDGSADGTGVAVHMFDDPRLIYVRQSNAGVSAARNEGVRRAQGRWVVFLDSDDEAFPNWLETLVGAIGKQSTGMVCSGEIVRNVDSGDEKVLLPQDLGAYMDHRVGAYIPGTFMVLRSVLLEAGGYVEGLTGSENTELFIRLLPALERNGFKTAIVNKPLIRRYYQRSRGDHRFFDGASYFLTHHQDALSKEPALYASYWSVAGVGHIFSNDFGEARACFKNAIRHHPRGAVHWIRYAMACVPFAARAFWNRPR